MTSTSGRTYPSAPKKGSSSTLQPSFNSVKPDKGTPVPAPPPSAIRQPAWNTQVAAPFREGPENVRFPPWMTGPAAYGGGAARPAQGQRPMDSTSSAPSNSSGSPKVPKAGRTPAQPPLASKGTGYQNAKQRQSIQAILNAKSPTPPARASPASGSARRQSTASALTAAEVASTTVAGSSATAHVTMAAQDDTSLRECRKCKEPMPVGKTGRKLFCGRTCKSAYYREMVVNPRNRAALEAKEYPTKKCGCGKEFTQWRKTQKFCKQEGCPAEQAAIQESYRKSKERQKEKAAAAKGAQTK